MDLRYHSTEPQPGDATSVTARRWSVADLIDLEYYLDQDEQRLRENPTFRKTLTERDRSLYLETIAPALGQAEPHTPAHRRRGLRRWLEERRRSEAPEMRALLPGAAFHGAQRVVNWLVAILGWGAGIAVASALLSYDGTRPISVSWYLFLLVFLQVALVFMLLGTWAYRRVRGRGAVTPPALLVGILRPVLAKTTNWLQGHRIGHATGEFQERARASQGWLKSQHALYGPLSYLPLLISAQVFGVAFNLGVILTTMSLEWFTDIAFGWGSTLNVHPQTIFDLSRLIALPWGWLLGEGVGYPSLEQVAGSRIILEHWASATPVDKPDPLHLRSWGSFLMLAVLTYGLLPRLLLLGGSLLVQRMILARLPMTHSRTQALYARMLSPRIETTPSSARQGAEMPIPAASENRSQRVVGDAAAATSARPWRNALVRRPAPGRPPIVADASTGQAAPTAPSTANRATPVAEPVGAGRPFTVARETAEPTAPSRSSPPHATDAQASASTPRPAGTGTVTAEQPIRPSVPAVTDPDAERSVTSAAAVASARSPVPPSGPATAPQQEETSPATKPRIPEPDPPSQTTAKAKTKAKTKAKAPSKTARVEVAPRAAPPETSTPSGVDAPARERAVAPPRLLLSPRSRSAPAHPAHPAAPVAPASVPETPIEPTDAGVAAAADQAVSRPGPGRASRGGERFAPDACLLLLHVDIDDILEDEDHPRLQQMLLLHTGWRVGATATFGAGSAMNEEALAVLEQGVWQAPPPRIAVIEDGSQPPITENLRFLRDLRAAAGPRAQITLALVGDPNDEDRLPPMRSFDFIDWQRKVDQMADPYLRLEMLAHADEHGEE